MHPRYRLFLLLALAFVLAFSASSASADPCLTVYPTGDTVYHYDINEYYVV